MSVLFGIFCIIQAIVTALLVCPFVFNYVNAFYGKHINSKHYPSHKYDILVHIILIIMIVSNPVIIAGFGFWLMFA